MSAKVHLCAKVYVCAKMCCYGYVEVLVQLEAWTAVHNQQSSFDRLKLLDGNMVAMYNPAMLSQYYGITSHMEDAICSKQCLFMLSRSSLCCQI